MPQPTNVFDHLTPKQVKFLIRDAAMVLWQGDDFDNFRDSRIFDDGWTEEQVTSFINTHLTEINKANKDIDKWIDGDAEIK